MKQKKQLKRHKLLWVGVFSVASIEERAKRKAFPLGAMRGTK